MYTLSREDPYRDRYISFFDRTESLPGFYFRTRVKQRRAIILSRPCLVDVFTEVSAARTHR